MLDIKCKDYQSYHTLTQVKKVLESENIVNDNKSEHLHTLLYYKQPYLVC